MYDGFLWQGRKIRTVGDILEAMQGLQDETQAQEFLKLAISVAGGPDEEIVRSNFGYITGYLSHERGKQLRQWFNTPHPIFGYRTPSPEQCMRYGKEVAEATNADPNLDIEKFAKQKGWWDEENDTGRN